MKATIYIPDDKAKLYAEAKKKLSGSISETFVHCLENALLIDKMATERIVVVVTDELTGRNTKKAFEGAWLIGGPGDGEEHFFDESLGIQQTLSRFSVARTKKGALVVLAFDRYGEVKYMSTYSDFAEFSNAADSGFPRYPGSLVAAVATELGEDHIEELDI
jgi:hypothetical protein